MQLAPGVVDAELGEDDGELYPVWPILGGADDNDDDRQELPTDRHFLELSETCLYMVHLGLGPFFPEVAKIVGT